jgi:predicted transcriptional regulator
MKALNLRKNISFYIQFLVLQFDGKLLIHSLIYCRELPVNVQKGLFKFMEQRGITLSATNYMHDYMVTKQNQEYVRWMRKLKDFVKQ